MGSLAKATLAQRIDKLLSRSIVLVFVVLCIYFITAHYWFLGFTSWDGLSYRIPPIIEFVQHGDLGRPKFTYPATQYAYPFFEWIHVPFLVVFGLKGLYFSFSTLLLPFSIVAVYLFVRILTDSSRWGMYSALIYLAIPYINTQPFSGYVDFAVIGALSFFLYALLSVLQSERLSVGSLTIFSIATFIFSMCRQQAPYLALLLAGVVTFLYIIPWEFSISSEEGEGWRGIQHLAILIVAFLIGIAPSAFLHIHRYLVYGSPIFPYQFSFYGIASDVGITQREINDAAGMIAPNWQGIIASFQRSWLFPDELPRDFFDSRILGAGFFFYLLFIALPIIEEAMNRTTTLILLLFGVIAIALQDFWLPRWSMTFVLLVIICVGGALSRLVKQGPTWAYIAFMIVVLLHLGRPLYDAYTMINMQRTSLRVNISGSPVFIDRDLSHGELTLYPDIDADFLIVPYVDHEFYLLLYGQRLTNQIVGILDPLDIGDDCAVPSHEIPGRQTLIVDHQGKLAQLSGTCEWICEYSSQNRCLAGRLVEVE